MTSTDRVALVTGAARGQGAAIVRRLHKDGFRVAACDVLADDLAVTGRVRGWRCGGRDCTRRDVRGSMAGRSRGGDRPIRFADHLGQQRRGLAPGLVRRRDGCGLRNQLACSTVWARSWVFGLRSRLFEAPSGAAIVNTCSTGAIRAFPNHTAIRLVQVGAAGTHPGVARRTRRRPASRQRGVPRAGRHPDARRDDAGAAGRARRRLGKAMEIADAVAFLVSEQASFITGAELVIDGGQTLQIG